MKDVGGEADIDLSGLNLFELFAHDLKVLRVVDFAAESVLNIVRDDVRIVGNNIEGILSIAARAVTHEKLTISAPLPDDMKRIMDT